MSTLHRQEIESTEHQLDAGRVPRTVVVELTEGLVDRVVPGDVATVTGVVKALSARASTPHLPYPLPYPKLFSK